MEPLTYLEGDRKDGGGAHRGNREEVIDARVPRRVAAAVLVVAVPFMVAWLVGDMSTTDVPDPDYAIRPPDLSDALQQGIGVVSLVLVVVSTGVLALSWRRDPPLPGFLWVLLPMVAIGVILGLSWQVMTAAVIGANIGVAFVIMLGAPVVMALLIVAGISAWNRTW